MHRESNLLQLLLGSMRFVRTEIDNFYLDSGGIPRSLDHRKVRREVARLITKHTGKRATKAKIETALEDIKDHVEAMPLTTATYCTGLADDGALIVNIGAGRVIRVSPDGCTLQHNLESGVLVVDPADFEPLDPDALVAAMRQPWTGHAALGACLLAHLPPAPPDCALSPIQRQAVVAAFWMGIFLLALAPGRPLLAFIGPATCGKSITMRLIMKLFYGAGADVGGGVGGSRETKDLCASVISRPLAARDDVNAAPHGIIDILCRIATGARFELSTLYKTLAASSYDPIAALMLTAVRARWSLRDDIMSRCLVIRMALPDPTTTKEVARYDLVAEHRIAVWAQTILALSAALARPASISVTRFGDWEDCVSASLGLDPQLGPALRPALLKMPMERIHVALAADPELWMIYLLACHPDVNGEELTAAQLVDMLVEVAGVEAADGDSHRARHAVRSPKSLANILSNIEEKGSAVVNITKRMGHDSKFLWCLTPKASIELEVLR